MADPHPLQAGDRSTNLSETESSTGADRRQQNYHGSYPGPTQDRAEGGPMWRVGQAVPMCQAPFNVIQMDGDANGQPTEVHELDIEAYGDCYDPTAPIRIRTVAPAESHWSLDSDHDGHRN